MLLFSWFSMCFLLTILLFSLAIVVLLLSSGSIPTDTHKTQFKMAWKKRCIILPGNRMGEPTQRIGLSNLNQGSYPVSSLLIISRTPQKKKVVWWGGHLGHPGWLPMSLLPAWGIHSKREGSYIILKQGVIRLWNISILDPGLRDIFKEVMPHNSMDYGFVNCK